MVASGQIIRASDVPVRRSSDYLLISAGTLDTTPSTSYTSRTGALAAITKLGATETNLRVALSISGFTITTNSTITFGVSDGSIDYDLCRFAASATSVRVVTGGTILLKSLPAGLYTIQLRHKAVSGTTVLRQASPDDFTTLVVTEVDA